VAVIARGTRVAVPKAVLLKTPSLLGFDAVSSSLYFPMFRRWWCFRNVGNYWTNKTVSLLRRPPYSSLCHIREM